MGIIKPLKNKDGKNVYPITRAEAVFVNDSTKLTEAIKNIENKRKGVVNTCLANISELKAKNVTEEINKMVAKESNWKSDLATEITKKGVETDKDSTYTVITDNIRAIPQDEYITESRHYSNVKEIQADYTIKNSLLDNVEITTEEEYGTETDDGKYKLTFSIENMNDNSNIAYKNSGAEILLPHKFNPGNRIFKKNDKYILEEPSINKISYDHKYKKGGYPKESMVGSWDRFGELAKPTNFRYAASSVVYKDKLYIFGNDKTYNPIAGGLRLQIYDFIFNTWEEVNLGIDTVDEYVNITNSMMVAYKDKLYMFGGVNTSTSTEVGYTQIYAYDIASKQFFAPYNFYLPVALTECGYTMIGDKVYIIGGRIVGGNYNTTTYCIDFDTFKVYDVPCLNISKLTSKLLFPIVTQIGDYIHIIGGTSNNSSYNSYMFYIPFISATHISSEWMKSYKNVSTNNGTAYTYCNCNGSLFYVSNTSSSIGQIIFREQNLCDYTSFNLNLPLLTSRGILCEYNNELYFYTKEYNSSQNGTFCKLHQELETPTWKPIFYADSNLSNGYDYKSCAVGDACYLFESRTNAIRIIKYTPKNNRTELLSDLSINHKLTDILVAYYNGIIYIQIGVELYKYNVNNHTIDKNPIILSTTNNSSFPYNSLKVFNGKLYCLGQTELVIVDLETYTVTNINRNGAYSEETLVSNRDKLYLLNMTDSNKKLSISELDIATNTSKLIKIINEPFDNRDSVEYMGHVYSLSGAGQYKNYKVLSLEDFTIKNGADYPMPSMKTLSTTNGCVFGNKIYIFGVLYTDNNGVNSSTNNVVSINLPSPHKQMASLTNEAIYNPINIIFTLGGVYFMMHYTGYPVTGSGVYTGQRTVEFNVSQTANYFSINKTLLSTDNILSKDDYSVTLYASKLLHQTTVLVCGGTILNNSGGLLDNGIYLEKSAHFNTTTPIITGPYDFGYGTSIVVGDELFVIFPTKFRNFGTSNQTSIATKDINIYDLKTNKFKKSIDVTVNGYHQISKINSYYYKGIIYITLNDTNKAYLYKFNVESHVITYRIIPKFDSTVVIQNYILIDEDVTTVKSGYIYMYDMEKDLLLSSSELPSYPLINGSLNDVRNKFTFQARELIFNAGGTFISSNNTGIRYCNRVITTKIPMLTCNESNNFSPFTYNRYNMFPVTKNNDVYLYSESNRCVLKFDSVTKTPYKIFNGIDYTVPVNLLFAGLIGSKYLLVYKDGTIKRMEIDNGNIYTDSKGFIAPFTGVYNKVISYKNTLYIIAPAKESALSRYSFSFSYENGYTELANIPGKARTAPSTCLVGNKIYCFGGLTEDNELLDECIVYDIETNTWSLNKSRMPYKCHEVQTNRVGNIIYIFGGTLSEDNINIIFYYIEEDRYEITDIPYSGGHDVSIAVLDKIYLFGKDNSHVKNSYSYPSDYSIRSIETHGWHKYDYLLPFFKWRTSVVKIGDYIYYTRLTASNLRLIAFDIKNNNYKMIGTQHNIKYSQTPVICHDDSKENIYYIYNGADTPDLLTMIKYNIYTNTETVLFENTMVGNPPLTSLVPIQCIHFYNDRIYFMTNVGDNKMYSYGINTNTFFIDTIKDTTGKMGNYGSLKIGTSLYYISIGTEMGGSDYISDIVRYDIPKGTFEKITIQNMPKDFYVAFNYNIFNIENKIYIHNYNYSRYNEDFLVIDLDTREAYFSNLLPSVGGHYSKIIYDENEKMIYMLGGYNMTPNNVSESHFDGTIKTLNYGEIKQYKTPKELIPIDNVEIRTKAHRTIIKPVNCPNINLSCDLKIDATPDK